MTAYSRTIVVTASRIIASNELVRSTAEYAIMLRPEAREDLTLTNDGRILVDSRHAASIAVGVWWDNGSRIDIVNNGLIDVVSHQHQAFGVANASARGTIFNHNDVRVLADRAPDPNTGTSAGSAMGLGGRRIINTGDVDVSSSFGNATGIETTIYAYVRNTGSVRVSGDTDVGEIIGIKSGSTDVQIDNSGTIEVVSNDGAMPTIGISLSPDNTNVYQSGLVLNSGTIIADTAIQAVEGYATGIYVTNSGRIEGDLLLSHNLNIVTNAAGGTWKGQLQFGADQDVLLNRGTITGSAFLAAGEDLLDGRGGSISGNVDGGEGRDLLYGGSGGDRLNGGAGDDAIHGGRGADSLSGGTGADRFVYTASSDSHSAGQDTISGFQTGIDEIDLSQLGATSVSFSSSGGYTIVSAAVAGGTVSIRVQGAVAAADVIMRAPTTDLTGTSADDFLIAFAADVSLAGGGGNDLLHGDAGANLLDGGAGADILYGGADDDIYVVDRDGDRTIELEGGGVDEVRAKVDYSLQAWMENALLLGSNTIGLLGNRLDNRLQGNSGDNVLRGGAGDDILTGRMGADAMEGGSGKDRFVYLTAADAVTARADHLLIEHGEDLVDLDAVSPVSYEFIERPQWNWGQWPWATVFSHWTEVAVTTASGATMTLWVQGQATLADFSANAPLAGTAIDDTLIGSSAANIIDGREGADRLEGREGNDQLDGGGGIDLMHGGAGHDTYAVGAAGDSAIEQAAAGTDTVVAEVSYVLRPHVERLILAGEADLTGTGNAEANVITGNAGSNRLGGFDGNDQLSGGAGNDGLNGGAGADTMRGGAGDDTYVVNDAGDRVAEAANEGTDLVRSSVTHTLAAGLENLIITGAAPAAATGNALANRIVGNRADNILNGGGGHDILVGGAGADIFRFDTAMSAARNLDRITDFSVAEDRIALDRSIFGGLGEFGILSVGAFRLGTAAADAGDRIIYDSSTGRLYYDADGDGAGAQVAFARVSAELALTHADFLVVA